MLPSIEWLERLHYDGGDRYVSGENIRRTSCQDQLETQSTNDGAADERTANGIQVRWIEVSDLERYCAEG